MQSQEIVREVLDQITKLRTVLRYGPYLVTVPEDMWPDVMKDYYSFNPSPMNKDGSNVTVKDRILWIEKVQKVEFGDVSSITVTQV